MLNIGIKIKKYRTLKKFSQLNLEVDAGLSIGSISRVENGKINPTKETLYKIAKSLNISKEEFIDLICYFEGVNSSNH